MHRQQNGTCIAYFNLSITGIFFPNENQHDVDHLSSPDHSPTFSGQWTHAKYLAISLFTWPCPMYLVFACIISIYKIKIMAGVNPEFSERGLEYRGGLHDL